MVMLNKDKYINQLRREQKTALNEHSKLLIKRADLERQLREVNKRLNELFHKYHNLQQQIESYQETGKKVE